jgi:hypothetical protein
MERALHFVFDFSIIGEEPVVSLFASCYGIAATTENTLKERSTDNLDDAFLSLRITASFKLERKEANYLTIK